VVRLAGRAGAEAGAVSGELMPDVQAEISWLAGDVADRWHTAVAERGIPPTAAVMVRRAAP